LYALTWQLGNTIPNLIGLWKTRPLNYNLVKWVTLIYFII